MQDKQPTKPFEFTNDVMDDLDTAIGIANALACVLCGTCSEIPYAHSIAYNLEFLLETIRHRLEYPAPESSVQPNDDSQQAG